MGNRMTRFSVAVLLTIMDIAVFARCWGVIWEAWSGTAWIRVVLISTLAIWLGSATDIWLHVYWDARQLLYQRRCPQTLTPAPVPTKLGEDSHV